MPKYLFQASYTPEGIAGIRSQGGSSRRDAVAATVEGLGGSVEALYFAFGDSDVVTSSTCRTTRPPRPSR